MRVPLLNRSPRAAVLRLEQRHALPHGKHERFTGYGVMGLAFASGDVLAFRRMVASSIGPPFTSVWHRDPEGRWTMFVDVEPDRSCPRFFGAALSRAVVTDVRVRWTHGGELTLAVPAVRLEWCVRVGAGAATRAAGLVGAAVPGFLWGTPALALMGAVGGPLLGAGRLRLHGLTPNRQRFGVRPRRVWRVNASAALVGGRDVGPVHRRPDQVRLGDFWIPAAGILALGDIWFERRDPSRHLTFEGDLVRR